MMTENEKVGLARMIVSLCVSMCLYMLILYAHGVLADKAKRPSFAKFAIANAAVPALLHDLPISVLLACWVLHRPLSILVIFAAFFVLRVFLLIRALGAAKDDEFVSMKIAVGYERASLLLGYGVTALSLNFMGRAKIEQRLRV